MAKPEEDDRLASPASYFTQVRDYRRLCQYMDDHGFDLGPSADGATLAYTDMTAYAHRNSAYVYVAPDVAIRTNVVLPPEFDGFALVRLFYDLSKFDRKDSKPELSDVLVFWDVVSAMDKSFAFPEPKAPTFCCRHPDNTVSFLYIEGLGLYTMERDLLVALSGYFKTTAAVTYASCSAHNTEIPSWDKALRGEIPLHKFLLDELSSVYYPVGEPVAPAAQRTWGSVAWALDHSLDREVGTIIDSFKDEFFEDGAARKSGVPQRVLKKMDKFTSYAAARKRRFLLLANPPLSGQVDVLRDLVADMRSNVHRLLTFAQRSQVADSLALEGLEYIRKQVNNRATIHPESHVIRGEILGRGIGTRRIVCVLSPRALVLSAFAQDISALAEDTVIAPESDEERDLTEEVDIAHDGTQEEEEMLFE